VVEQDTDVAKDWHPALSKYQFVGVKTENDDVFGV